MDARDDMVEAAIAPVKPLPAIKAHTALARMDDLAQRGALHEIHLLKIRHDGRAGPVMRCGLIRAHAANLFGQAHFHLVPCFGALDQMQRALGNEAADGCACGPRTHASAAGQPGNGKVQAGLAFEPAVAQEIRIDGVVDWREAKARHHEVFHLFPDLQRVNCASAPVGSRAAGLFFADGYTIELFVFHDFHLEWEWRSDSEIGKEKTQT